MPMRYSQFLQYVNDKYDDVNAVHHYEVTQSSGDTTTKIEVYSNSALFSGDTDFYGTATPITNLEYEESLQDQRRKIKLLDPNFLPQFIKEFESLMGEFYNLMSGISYAGEYDLREMKILTSAGNILDVKNLVQVIEIFEDINSPALTGSLTLLDIDNILENAPIIGQEYLSLVISTPTLEDIRMDFGEKCFRNT